MTDDAALIDGYKAGDHGSFEALMLKYRIPALHFALRYVRDVYIAEDIVQDSFADLYVYRNRYRKDYSFKTYLFAILKNKSIDFLRKRKPECLYESTFFEEMFEQDFLERENCNWVRKNLNRLKADYRTVIYLKEYEGFSYQEIGEIMEKNQGQVKILIFRAKRKLKDLLEAEA